MKIQKKNLAEGGGGGLVGGGVRVGGRVRLWGGGQGECERRIEVFVKIQKKKNCWGGGGRVRGGGSGWWGGVRVDVKEELKFL